jgi:thiol-disulfide isomerase/thioredoxin
MTTLRASSRISLSAALLLILLCCAACAPGSGGSLAQGDRAPSFELSALNGDRVASSSLAGELVILNFWATWCGPCRMEIPALKALDAEPDVRVVGISLDFGAEDAVGDFVSRHRIGYTTLLGDEAVAQAYRVHAIPTTVVLDRSQTVVRLYRGLVSEATLRAAVARARAAG